MKYSEVRDQIKTGDVLSICGTNFFSLITRIAQHLGGMGKFTGVTHSGVAWWIGGRLYCVEMDGKHNVLRPVSQHVAMGCRIFVHKAPVNPDLLEATFDQATENPIDYSVWDLARIGIRLIFKKQIKDKNVGDRVCSTFVSWWLILCGWTPTKYAVDLPSPAELAWDLPEPFLNIDPN